MEKEQKFCQSCGMPLGNRNDFGTNADGSLNEEYCKWCYTEGKFTYTSLEELTDFLIEHMSSENWPPEQARAFFESQLPNLSYWKQQKK